MNWLLLMIVFGLTLVIFLIVMFGMAIGVVFGKRRLTGSCGGLANMKSSDSKTNCSLCMHANEGCIEKPHFGQKVKDQ
jgi:hypothetical protein